MSGEIIEFRRHHDLKRAERYRKQAVPRGPAGQARLEQQIARISGLLEELENLTGGATAPLLVQARASIEKAGGILPGGRFAVSGPDETGEGDPQPDVDRELLERMYCNLDLHA